MYVFGKAKKQLNFALKAIFRSDDCDYIVIFIPFKHGFDFKWTMF